MGVRVCPRVCLCRVVVWVVAIGWRCHHRVGLGLQNRVCAPEGGRGSCSRVG